jgi:hypothetical protein
MASQRNQDERLTAHNLPHSLAFSFVTRYTLVQSTEGASMPAPAERMKRMRERRRKRGLRELRIVIPDPRLTSVRRRVAAQVARLIPGSEDEALSWIEAVSEFDSPNRQADDEAR